MKKRVFNLSTAVLILGLVWLLIIPPGGDPLGLPEPRNAVWLDRYWLRGTKTEAEMALEVGRMSDRNVKTLFVHAGPFGPAGLIPAYETTRVTMIKKATRLIDAEIRVLAWLGGRNAAGGGDLDLTDEGVRANVCTEAVRLVAAGFDGVHMNIEPTATGDEGLLLLLKDLRGCLPQGAFLSLATNLWGPWWLPNRSLFSEAYLRQIATLVDQIAVMNYDTYAISGPLYQRISAAQTKAALRAVSMGDPQATVLLGLPAYPTEGGMRHDAKVESASNALAGIDAGLAQVTPSQRDRFEGVAIYAGWTATERDWHEVGSWHRP